MTLRLVVAGEVNASTKHNDDTIRMKTLSHILAPVLQFEVLRLMAMVTVAPTYLSIVEGALSFFSPSIRVHPRSCPQLPHKKPKKF